MDSPPSRIAGINGRAVYFFLSRRNRRRQLAPLHVQRARQLVARGLIFGRKGNELPEASDRVVKATLIAEGNEAFHRS